MRQIDLLTTPQAANLLNMKIKAMAEMRMRGEGPPYLRLGRRTIRYDRDDLIRWAMSKKKQSTSE